MIDPYVIVAGLLSTLLYLTLFSGRRKLDHIPTVGYSSSFLSWYSAFKFMWAGREIIEEGYRKYPNKVWKLPTTQGWIVIANGTGRLEEISKAGDEQLSAVESFNKFLQLDYTLGTKVTTNPYHINVVRAAMTRNIVAQFDDVRDEMLSAFEEAIPSNKTEWHSIPVHQTVEEIMSKIAARMSVGRPLSDNKEFREICNRSGAAIFRGRILRHFPTLLKPLASRMFIGVYRDLADMKKLLEPLVVYRLEQERLHGFEWPDKPNDLLTWLLEEASRVGEQVTAHNMAVRIYFLAFASQTSSMMLTCALYEIATRAEYLPALRGEVETVLSQEGWSKAAVSKMFKLDSFLREVLRCYDTELLHLGRKVLKDFMFSDGTLIPAGSTLRVNSYGSHHNEDLYPSPHSFQGFRFVNEDSLKQIPSAKPTLDYNPFGYGKHACPGRFFAAAQLKLMLAHIVTTYDVKTEVEGVRPDSVWSEASVIPNLSAKILFRKRR
ncbi:cytochrome P450 [Crassisporium funariophilum]|nr:cytochrome P450 [Crassisporium funariophilum]